RCRICGWRSDSRFRWEWACSSDITRRTWRRTSILLIACAMSDWRILRIRAGASLVAIIGGVLLACVIGRAQVGSGAPTYYREVLPILRGHCEVCHRAGGIA